MICKQPEQNPFIGKVFTSAPERVDLFVKVVPDYVNSEESLRVLDLGCGTGGHLFALAEVLPRGLLLGVDISAENIRIAEGVRKTHPAHRRITFVEADYMAYHGGCYDLIISGSTLQNIPATTADLFSKISKELVDGGLLLFSVPSGCVYNQVLWIVRRLFRLIRGRITDALVLSAATWIHGHRLDREFLRERVHCMYLVPYRYDCMALRAELAEDHQLDFVGQPAVYHTSLAQTKDVLTVYKKRPQ